MACLLVSYYVFDLAYPKRLKSTLFFIQKEFTKIHGKSEQNQRVLQNFIYIDSIHIHFIVSIVITCYHVQDKFLCEGVRVLVKLKAADQQLNLG